MYQRSLPANPLPLSERLEPDFSKAQVGTSKIKYDVFLNQQYFMENYSSTYILPLRHLSCTNPLNTNELNCALFIYRQGHCKLIYFFRLKEFYFESKKLNAHCNSNITKLELNISKAEMIQMTNSNTSKTLSDT